MKAEELRIGNLITETIVPEVHVFKDVIINVDIHHLSRIGSIEWEDAYKPIQLTEEWLIKLGFSNEDYIRGRIGIDYKAGTFRTNFVLLYPGIIGTFQKHFAWEFTTGSLPKYNELEYVHELQNLFFALTNKELVLTK